MIPMQAKIVGLLIACILVFGSGWKVRDWKADADLAKILLAEAEQKAQYEELTNALVKRYLEQQEVFRVEYRKIKGRIPDVTDNRICFADSAALSVWNDSLNGVSSSSTRATGKTSGTGATDREVLTNAAENFEQYTSCRKQVNGIIDWYELKYKVKH